MGSQLLSMEPSHWSKLNSCKRCPPIQLSLSELRHLSFSLYGWPLQENDWLHWFVFFHLPNWLSLIHANFHCFFKLTFEIVNQDQSFGNFIMCCQSFSPDNMKYFFVFSSKILHISFINTKYQLSLKNLTFRSFLYLLKVRFSWTTGSLQWVSKSSSYYSYDSENERMMLMKMIQQQKQ